MKESDNANYLQVNVHNQHSLCSRISNFVSDLLTFLLSLRLSSSCFDSKVIFSMEIQERNDAPLEMRREEHLLIKIFKYIFCLQFLLIMILELYLIVRGVISVSDTHRFHPKKWYLPVLSSTACAGIIGFAWQMFTSFNPSRAFKAAFFVSPLVTCGYGILLVSIGTPGSSAAAVIVLAASVFQSLYGCWIRPRFQHASRILVVSTAYHPPRIKIVVPLSILVCILYSTLLMSGIGGATATGTTLNTLFIFLSLLSFVWTLTSSFCFLSGTAAGSVCALVAGTWAVFVHKSYATEVSLYTFLTGYLVNRVAMAWIQASVAAYYVAYAENPQNQQFDGTIPDYSQALQRLHG